MKQHNFGLESERNDKGDVRCRWCSGCAKSHAGSVQQSRENRKKCEDCGLKVPSFGLESERKVRWCHRCSETHAGSVSLPGKVKLCEDCGLKHPNFGMVDGERKARWCSGCGKAHGAVSLRKRRQCEDCGLKVPNFGLESERKVRWCGPCAKAHGGVNYRASTANSTTARTARRKRAVGRASTAGATKRGRGQNSYSEKGRTEA